MEKYKEIPKGRGDETPVGTDKNIVAALVQNAVSESEIEAILESSPVFQELNQVQGEAKARQYLELIINDQKLEQFIKEHDLNLQIETLKREAEL